MIAHREISVLVNVAEHTFVPVQPKSLAVSQLSEAPSILGELFEC
jgi:hypothetical protein